MKLPHALLGALTGLPGFNSEAFEQVHEQPESLVSLRFNPDKMPGMEAWLPLQQRVPWSRQGWYLEERPSFTLDPLFHAGAYYVQEASSMFIEEAIRQITIGESPLKALDLCAAPGGKSTLLQSCLPPHSLLVSNEVIRSRANILEENLIKWGNANLVITQNDPADFARLPSFFDLMLIDAPCSGSGLFRRDPGALDHWSEANVQLCSERQQRILAQALPALSEEGVLIYSTCSYSRDENETIVSWLMEHFDLSSVRIELQSSWQITETCTEDGAGWGYRFWPNAVRGEGFFMACFRKRSAEKRNTRQLTGKLPERLTGKEEAVIRRNVSETEGWSWWRQGNLCFAFPAAWIDALSAIMAAGLYIRLAGTRLGKLADETLIPDHALAMSSRLAPQNVAVPLNIEQALQFLRRDDVNLASTEKGWRLFSYASLPLGWAKMLGNRINNYYPKEWRILRKAEN